MCSIIIIICKYACEWEECSKFSSSQTDFRSSCTPPIPSLLSWVTETSNTHNLSRLLSFICCLHTSEGKRKSHTDSRSWCRVFPVSRLNLEAQTILTFTKMLEAYSRCNLMQVDVISWADFRIPSSILYPTVKEKVMDHFEKQMCKRYSYTGCLFFLFLLAAISAME